jgi:hypothetical protein
MWVDLVDACEVGREYFPTRRLLRTDLLGKFERRHLPQFTHAYIMSPDMMGTA